MPRASRRLATLGPVALFAVAGLLVQLLRQPGQHAIDTIWAEDGGLYATQAYHLPATSTLFLGYGGYAQFVPRVLALGARAVPVADLARYDAVVAAGVWVVLGLFVHRSSQGWVTSPWLRWLLAGFFVAAPIVYVEANANITNLGWAFVVAAFWAVVSRRNSAADVVLRCVVLALAALSTPVTVVVLPMAVVVFVRRRQKSDAWVAAAGIAALAVQALAVHSTAPAPTSGSWTVSDLVTEYGVRALAASVVGERWLETAWLTLGYLLVAGVIVALVAFVLVCGPRQMPTDRWVLAAGLVATSALTMLLTVQAHGSQGLRLTTNHFEVGGARYYVVPVLLLMSAIVVVADGARRPWLVPMVAFWGVALIALHLREPSGRSLGPSWHAGVVEAKATCEAPSAPKDVQIPISPQGWYVLVPCGRLT